MSTLRIDGVSHLIGGRTILSDVSLEFSTGELVALIGPNGAGKSTLIAALAGDIHPTSGHISIDGRHVHALGTLPLARQRAVLLQQSTVAFSYRVDEVVRMGRTPWRGQPEAEHDDDVIRAALEATETSSFAERDITTLSGGENARVQLARILAQSTAFVILDEPTAAMDIRHQESTMAQARTIVSRDGCALVVLHDLDMAAAYADRIVLMHHGRVIANGPPAEVCTAERLSSVYDWPIDVVQHPHTGRVMVMPRRGHMP